MALIDIAEIRLHRVSVPLKQPFTTHLQKVTERESILVEVVDSKGIIGLGECVAFSAPWYTEETCQSCWDTLVNWLIPAVIGKAMTHPSELCEQFKHVKGNRMAKASLDLAVWDLFAKKQDVPLWKLLGGERSEIDAGIVLTGEINEHMYEATRSALETGYQRVKVKIDERTDPHEVKKLVTSFPQLLFFADANGIFDRLGLEALLTYDHAGLTLIEQPFGEDEWEQHKKASALMRTPIALDESIRSVADARRMIKLEAGSVIVLKPGRVGGITASLNIHELAKQHAIPVWMGGMIEFGISKAHNLALASLAQMTYPGDFSASTHFWAEDPIEPIIEVVAGTIALADVVGIGYEINHAIMEKYVKDQRIFRVSS